MTNKAEQLLKDSQLRITSTRVSILEQLMDVPYATSSQELEESVGQIDRVTLYRTLKSFEQKGIIHKITDLQGTTKYALCDHLCSDQEHSHDHFHFNCSRCGNTYCIDEVDFPKIAVPNGYICKEIQINIIGVCKECNN